MKFYLFRLIPPRPTFPADMTPAESEMMREHSTYWRDLMGRGLVVAYGPVADPKGAYGIALLRLEDGADARALAIVDPAIKAGAGFTFEVHSMPQLVVAEGHA